jgi:hypothetical protein
VNRIITRRRFITTTLAAAGAASGAVLAPRYGLVPPDNGGLFGAGETVTFAAHRLLLYSKPLAREFSRN